MEIISNLKEVTHESVFKWRINNISAANNGKNYIIQSKEIDFADVDASWFLKVEPVILNTNETFLSVKFCVRDSKKDENARYKFNLKVRGENGKMRSLEKEIGFIQKNRVCKGYLMEVYLQGYLPVTKGENFFVLEATCTIESLIQEYYEDDFDHLNDDDDKNLITEDPEPVEVPVDIDLLIEATETTANEEIVEVTLPKDKENEVKETSAITCQKTTQESAESEKQIESLIESAVTPVIKSSSEESSSPESIPSESSGDAERKRSKKQGAINKNLCKRVQKIYMIKMRQIAETSARLFVTSARVCLTTNDIVESTFITLISFPQNKYGQLLVDTSNSLAAQLTQETFVEMWKIAGELEVEPLKKAIISYVVANRGRLTYSNEVPSDLMADLVKAIN